MHVVINGRFLTQPVTGVQRYAHEVTRALDDLLDERSDVSLEILCPELNGPTPIYRNIAVRSVGSAAGHAWEQMVLPRAFKGDALFCPGNTAPIASLLGKPRVVVCVHDLSYLYFPTAYSLPFRAVYNVLTPTIFRHADHVITVSNSERTAITARYPHITPRITAVQNGGLSEAVDTHAEGASPDHPAPGYVLYVGSLSKRKNFPRMFEVACDLARRRGQRTVFVGGTAASLEQSDLTIDPDIADKIIFAGQINDTDRLVQYYKGASVFMFPSLYEASPLPPIEAMACGVPVVSSTIPSLLERCGDAAIYCDAEDVASIASQVEALLDDENLAKSIRLKGRERAKAFNWRNCAERTLELIVG
ncbi:glycosyltransferase family 1 protein [Novosphingobium sp. PS1R-30]|uniref:Glycosyltransferase family 1 protein n=1 Tax=Novosphingobium anseongense TaxID=3133436 RepID=A0ABU8RYM9_9SPHN